jgi:hypothetical protein
MLYYGRDEKASDAAIEILDTAGVVYLIWFVDFTEPRLVIDGTEFVGVEEIKSHVQDILNLAYP